MTTVTGKVKVNYTPAQEALIVAASHVGPLNLAAATVLASNPAMNDGDKARTPRAIVAKIVRMGLPYEKKVAARKDGTAVAAKADIVAQIAKTVKGNLEGLDKAPRAALVAIQAALAA